MKTRTRVLVVLGVVAAALPVVAVTHRGAPRRRGALLAAAPSVAPGGARRAGSPEIQGVVAGLNPAAARPGPDGRFVAALPDGRTARLTLEPEWQRATAALLARHAMPQASVVVLDTDTGRVLVWASRGAGGRDLARDAEAPAASVFKIVTGSALLAHGMQPDETTCFSGGFHRLMPADLTPDPRRDRECVTLGEAFARSINTVFARRALAHLRPDLEAEAARRWGFGAELPFDAPVARSVYLIPEDTLGFARTAAGFWNTSLSPLHGALLAQGVALRGEMRRPWIVESIRGARNEELAHGTAHPWRRATSPEVAAVLQRAMLRTVTDGTGFHGFHDPAGRLYLDGVTVGGKTGTLTQDAPYVAYTWFVGNAEGEGRRLSFGVMVGNGPTWRVKAATLARQVLQIAFRGQPTD
ncbi:MAG: penicillin-binding transpeptidase domain-containing protein [Polyangiales bacterium]